MAELWGYRVGRGGFSSACLPARAPPPAAGPSAPPFPPTRPGAPRHPAPRPVVASPSGVRPPLPDSPALPATSLEVGPEGSGVGW